MDINLLPKPSRSQRFFNVWLVIIISFYVLLAFGLYLGNQWLQEKTSLQEQTYQMKHDQWQSMKEQYFPGPDQIAYDKHQSQIRFLLDNRKDVVSWLDVINDKISFGTWIEVFQFHEEGIHMQASFPSMDEVAYTIERMENVSAIETVEAELITQASSGANRRYYVEINIFFKAFNKQGTVSQNDS